MHSASFEDSDIVILSMQVAMKLFQSLVDQVVTLQSYLSVKEPNSHSSLHQSIMLETGSHWILQCRTMSSLISPLCLPHVPITAAIMETARCLGTVCVKMDSMESTVAKV